jgi:K+-sensing histidine kinase KdpD
LNHHLPTVRDLVKAGEPRAGSGKSGTFGLHEEWSSDRALRRELLPLLMSLVIVGLVTAVLFWLDQTVAVDLVPIAYLIPVIVAATQWGIWPATLASIASTAAADFLFFPPVYSFEVEDPQEVIDLLLFLVVALVSSNLASRLRRETETLRRREAEIQHLYEFSRRLAACFTISDLISAIQNYLSYALGLQAVFLAAKADGHFELPESAPMPQAVHESVVSMIGTADIPSRTVVDEQTLSFWVLGAVRSETAVLGLVAVNIGAGSREAIASRKRRVEDTLEGASLTFQHLDIARAMQDARLHLQAQLLRDAFHGTLSHELYSPLAAIRGSATVLDSMSVIQGDDRARALVEAISDQTAHLDGFIHNLLNATRVTAGGVSPRPEWADARDVVNAAIKGRARRLAAHKVVTAFAEDLPLIKVDSGLVEEACGQLLENAAKYSSSGSTISIDARAGRGRVILSITDQGFGITPDDQRHLGRRSFRSQRHQATIPGSGLGLWIASAFVRANGGTIDISSRGQGQGTTASIALPCSPIKTSELADLTDE